MLPSAFTYVNPYSIAGNVFDILAAPIDISEIHLEQRYAELTRIYKTDPAALKILAYARVRVRLMRGWEWLGGIRLLSFEQLSATSYRPDSDLFHIFHYLIDEEHKHFYLRAMLVPGSRDFARYLAMLNIPDAQRNFTDSLDDLIGDLDLYNRNLARDLHGFVTRLADDSGVSAAEVLFRVLKEALSFRLLRDISRVDRGPLVGLILDVARRLPQRGRQNFFAKLESLVGWTFPLTVAANAVPIVPYFNPDHEIILRRVKHWMIARWRKPPPSVISSVCSRLLGQDRG